MREQRNTSVVLLVMLGQQQQINLLETRLEKISILMVEMLEVIQTITDLVLETITLVKNGELILAKEQIEKMQRRIQI
jgi:hypothetical protein